MATSYTGQNIYIEDELWDKIPGENKSEFVRSVVEKYRNPYKPKMQNVKKTRRNIRFPNDLWFSIPRNGKANFINDVLRAELETRDLL